MARKQNCTATATASSSTGTMLHCDSEHVAAAATGMTKAEITFRE
jgi:hypothetical protein